MDGNTRGALLKAKKSQKSSLALTPRACNLGEISSFFRLIGACAAWKIVKRGAGWCVVNISQAADSMKIMLGDE